MIRHKLLPLIAIILISCSDLHAYNLTHISDKRYMTNSSITSLSQNEKGLMWIGTCDGINIYDGQKIEGLKLSGHDNYISGNLIDQIISTGNDIYWIQTYYGLNRLDKRNNRITHYKEFQKFFFMAKDHSGTLYVLKDNNSIYYYRNGAFNKINTMGVPFNDIVDFFIDENDVIWIILKQYSYCYAIRKDQKTGNIILSHKKSNFNINSTLLYSSHDKKSIYYIDDKYNLYDYDIYKSTNKYIINLKEEINTRGRISAIVKSHNSYFIGFVLDGLLKLEKDRNNLYEIKDMGINCGIFSIEKDLFQDIVWIGTDGQGIYLYSSKQPPIKSVTFSKSENKINRPIRALLWDKERTLWIGLKGEGLLKVYNYNPNKEISEFKSEKITSKNSELKSNAVYSIAQSQRNILWIGTEEGLNYYSYKENKTKKISLTVDGTEFKYIHDIREVNGSEIWFASAGLGVLRASVKWNNNTPTLTNLQRYSINQDNFESNYFFTIYVAENSDILFGNKGYGAYFFNRQTNSIEPYAPSRKEYMALNNVLAISKDTHNNLLFGTSFGLLKYSPDKSYKLFNVDDGFPNGTIHSIQKDINNTFWLATNIGLIKFDSNKNIFRSYGISEGLDVVEFCDGASFKDETTGTIFFGGINGFTSISPRSLTEKAYMPPIDLNKLYIFGKEQNMGEFMQRKGHSEIIRLSYDQNFFSLSFASADFLNGSNRTFYYKLQGVNDNWINNGQNNEISFTNMAPGKYTLSIKYYNSAYDKESNVYSYIIIIANPWYTSVWAYLIYLITLSVIVMLIVRHFKSKVQEKKQKMMNEMEIKHQKKIFDSKLQFFTNIAHEFYTPLTLIYGPCKRILSSSGLNSFISNHVQMIQTNAEKLNNLIEELIEFRRIETGQRKPKIESISITEACNNLLNCFSDLAQSKQVILVQETAKVIEWNTDSKFFDTILTNLISYAFGSLSGKDIRINIDKKSDLLLVDLTYEGNIDEKELSALFNHHAALDDFEIKENNQFTKGHLSLPIAYNMAKLLNGDLVANRRKDKCIVFTLTLPFIEVSKSKAENKQMEALYTPQANIQKITKLPEYKFDESKSTVLVINEEIDMIWFIGELLYPEFNFIPLQKPEQIDEKLNEISPSLIIYDITTQGKQGMSAIKGIKSKQTTAHIPIIIISGQHEMNEQMALLAIGADMYIPKPFNPEYLRISVNQLLEKKEVLKNYFHSPISSFEKKEGKLTHKESKVFLQSVLNIINENLTNPDLSPRFIAQKLAISPRSLYRKMEEIKESSPTDLIRECRMHIAEDLLLTTQKTIDEIAFETGFTNKVTFFKTFREKHNCTPKSYRLQHLEDLHTKL